MPIHCYWEDPEKTILRHDFEGVWTWDEMYTVFYEAVAMETAVTHRVDVILDLRKSTRIMPGNVLSHVKNFSEKQPPNVGLCIFVTTNPFAIAMYGAAVRFSDSIAHYFRLTRTLDEAHAMIAEARRTLVAAMPS